MGSLLESTLNTRDLGGFPISAGRWTQRNRIWRSDAPVVFCETDEQRLKNLNITTIIDLRTDSETERRPCAYAGRPGFTYQHFPITAGSVPPDTLEEVPFTYLQIAQQREAAEAIHAGFIRQDNAPVCLRVFRQVAFQAVLIVIPTDCVVFNNELPVHAAG